MSHAGDLDEKVRWFRALVQAIPVATLTTVAEDGALHSRPLATAHVELEGTLWFFLSARAPHALEIGRNPRVHLSYVGKEPFQLAAITGTAIVLRDEAKAKELWTESCFTWFPGGPSDPDVALLRVTVETVEYWESPRDLVAKMVELVSPPESAMRVSVAPASPFAATMPEVVVPKVPGTGVADREP